MEKNELTVIIPFLNEKYEVENTLQSIREYSDDNVKIILINDASDDNFDYKIVAEKYGATYFINKKRLGVASSRDIGVQACKTPFFLLLDAHMRFYDNLWSERIIEELRIDSKTLLCCQTKVLIIDNGFLSEVMSSVPSYGAFVRLNDEIRMFEPCWIGKELQNTKLLTIPIPCVLGAGYACSKEYWQHLKGLEGLMQYGNDEAYISIKAWLSGGSCKLVKDVVVGHIYRDDSPFSVNNTYRLYNRLFLSELLLPLKMKKKFFSESKSLYERECYSEALYKLYENTEQINRLKKHYEKIFTKKFVFFKRYNNKYAYTSNSVIPVRELLKNIVDKVSVSLLTDIGISNGQMGIVIFLYQYAKYAEDQCYKELSDKMLMRIIQSVKPDSSYCFISGLCGIGWGIEYLYQNNFIEGDTNEILDEFDRRIMEIDPLRVENIDKNYGLGGIVLYLIARLYTIQQKGKSNPFDNNYLSNIYERVHNIIEGRITTSDSIDIFLTFINYYERKSSIEKPDIFDVHCLLNRKNTPIQDLDLGLNGCAGIGLRLIFEEYNKV